MDVIVLLLIVWASDIGAYLVGRAVGGPKLAPAISPGKTVSGAVGGLLAAMLVGLVVGLAESGPLGRAMLVSKRMERAERVSEPALPADRLLR